MERVNITGEVYEPKENPSSENAPEPVGESKREKRVLKTEIGVFRLNGSAEVTDKYSGSALYNIDWDEYSNQGEHSIELVKNGFELYFLTPVSNMLSVGEKYLIDVQEAQETFGFEADSSELIIEIEDRFQSNVNANDQKSLEFLNNTYEYQLPDEYSTPQDYPEKEFSYLVQRADENTLVQKTTLSQTTIDVLRQKNAIHRLRYVK